MRRLPFYAEGTYKTNAANGVGCGYPSGCAFCRKIRPAKNGGPDDANTIFLNPKNQEIEAWISWRDFSCLFG